MAFGSRSLVCLALLLLQSRSRALVAPWPARTPRSHAAASSPRRAPPRPRSRAPPLRAWTPAAAGGPPLARGSNSTSGTVLRGSAAALALSDVVVAPAPETATVVPAPKAAAAVPASVAGGLRPLAAAVGPFLSVALTLLFLLHTLVAGDGLSDAYATMDLPAKLDVLSRISWFPGTYQEAQVVVALVMAAAAFAQALSGFGFAVLAVGALSGMPWLLHSEIYDVMTPAAATLGAMVGFILLIPAAFAEGPATEDEPGLDWGEIMSLLVPCTVLTPLGMRLEELVDPVVGTRALAALIMAFVAYKLAPMLAPDAGADAAAATALEEGEEEGENFLQTRAAAVLLGSAAGIFGGAFDVQGPPLCVYGDAKGWSPAQFRNNVLAVVCLNSAFVVAVNYFEGNLGSFYYSYFCLTSLPGVLLGLAAGQYASRRIDPVLFKNLILLMCLGLGIQLLSVS